MSQPWPVNHGGIDTTPESDPASLSPRTDLLSPEPFEEAHLGPPGRIPRGPGVKFRHERERAHSTASPHELLRMLINEEYESKQTRKILYTAFDRLEQETKRADAAEARIEETIQRARAINDARIAAQREAARAQEELNLYKLQLSNAQKEINRAQDVLKAIEAQRDEAENAAVEARSKARKLNEERLIELAREEGRRLGFEEGVRRGRKMAYRDGYEEGRQEVREVATAAVDRLLEAQEEEQEEIEVLEEATPIPPPSSSRTAPEVHRLETPVNSSLEPQRHSSRSTRDSTDSAGRSTLRRAPAPEPVIPPPTAVEPRIIPAPPTASSQSSRHQPEPQPQPQPWPVRPVESFSRPVSVRNSPPSVQHAEIHVPPDGYIPTADENLNINLPPPHELHRTIPSPTPEQQAAARPDRRRSRDYIYDNSHPPRRASPDESLASTKQSAASTISQLDIVGLPSGSRRRDRSQGLSVIHEDASVRSGATTPYSQTAASTSHSRHSQREMERESTETLRQERKAKQQLADELRYSDPTQPEQWRRYAESSRSQSTLSGPPKHRPVVPTIPTPLSPPRVVQDVRHRRVHSERQGRPETRSDHVDQRRPLSSDSSVPEISVEPPSGPPSDAPSRGRGDISPNDLLSPDHANRPLPIPAPPDRSAPVVPTVPNTPETPHANLAGQIYNVLPNGQLPPGFFPSPSANTSSQGPVIPQNTGGPSHTQTQTHRHVSPYGPPASSSERESGRTKTPISFYAQSPVPPGVNYPAPPISRSATYSAPSYAGSAPSGTSEGGRRRRDSLSATAGMTPAARPKPIQSTSSTTTDGGSGPSGRDARVSKRQSTTSLGSQQSRPSYARYNPSMYNDPAYLASNDSLMDPVTDANTVANGGGGGAPIRMRKQGSPEYTYADLRTRVYD